MSRTVKYLFIALVMTVMLSGCSSPTDNKSDANFGNIKITGDFEAEYTFDKADYTYLTDSFSADVRGYYISLESSSSGIRSCIEFRGIFPQLCKWYNGSGNSMYVQRGLEDCYDDGVGEILITKLDTKEIVGKFKGYLESDSKRIYVEGNFRVPR